MISTSSQKTYTDLLIQYQPKSIKTESEYQEALTIVEGMMSGKLTEAETALFELLVLLRWLQNWLMVNGKLVNLKPRP